MRQRRNVPGARSAALRHEHAKSAAPLVAPSSYRRTARSFFSVIFYFLVVVRCARTQAARYSAAPVVEVQGMVNQDRTISEKRVTPFGADFNLENYAALVQFAEMPEHRSIFI